jgi:Ca-activated chloride channel homolog
MLKKILIFLFFIAFICQISFSNTIRISQIDTSDLLLNQKVKVYLGITDNKGNTIKNLKAGQFTVYESADGTSYSQTVGDNDLKFGINYEKGINFLILIDNSGSMYDDIGGKATKDESKMRMTYVKNAVRSFTENVNPDDRVGIASYNSYYTLYAPPSENIQNISDIVNNIKKPEGDDGWTEIYSSLTLAIKDFSGIKGRKAIIILTDGENMPYFKYTKKPHKEFGEKIFTYDEPLNKALEEGVTIYSINYGSPDEKKDSNLGKISIESGGVVFNAYDENELKNVYTTIKNQILNEYLLTYNATMIPSTKKFVKVDFKYDNGAYDATRYYFASTIFGMPMNNFTPAVFLAFLLACILLFLLSLLKFNNKVMEPSLEVLSSTQGKALTKLLTLNKGKTVIGGSTKANMTIIGAPGIRDNHATIVYDNAKKAFTVVSEDAIKVNNKKTKSRILEDGDVLNVGGTTIVFDKGMMNNGKTRIK